MVKLSNKAIEFSKNHIQNFYDSDFFPKALEFKSLFHDWKTVKSYLKKDLNDQKVYQPNVLTSPKPRGGFRVVHQLEPINTLTYTAMAYEVARKVEKSRKPNNIACSYRINIDHGKGNFFAKDNGYNMFLNTIKNFSDRYTFFLKTDITDFYNQIYIHRVQNELECIGVEHELTISIENFLHNLNGRMISMGLPVGPAASIIFSEAILNDIDKFIERKGFEFTRYVDDIIIFSNSEHELLLLFERLVHYVHQIHRLNFSEEKTEILNVNRKNLSIFFKHSQLHSLIDSMARYQLTSLCDDDEEDEEDEELEDEDEDDSLVVLNIILYDDELDLGLARHFIREAKKQRNRSVLPGLLENFDFFAPIINDYILYLKKVSGPKMANYWTEVFEDIIDNCISSKYPLVKHWLEAYFISSKEFLSNKKIADFLMNSKSLMHKVIAAIKMKDTSLLRSLRHSIDNYGREDRRAVLLSSLGLSYEERQHWLNHMRNETDDVTELAFIKWVKSISVV